MTAARKNTAELRLSFVTWDNRRVAAMAAQTVNTGRQ
jgi:hypothetical protein